MSILAGLRVVEMGLWVAAPAAGGTLADWGAEVIKIEAPSGDPMRGLFGALSGSKETRCPPFDLHNRGKRSVAVDTTYEEGRQIVERIIGSADVFLTNLRPASLERLGLDHQRLRSKYPRLIYASLTGYGHDGPDRDAPGYDVAAFAARGGVADRSTPPGDAPVNLASGMGDTVTGIATVAGILAAIVYRERTGEGRFVSTSLLRAGTYCIGMDLATRLTLGRLAPTQRRTAPPNPLLNPYAAGDGRWFWLIGAESERHWPKLLAATGDSRLTDERFSTPRGRRRNADFLVSLLDEIFGELSRDQWAHRFDEEGVWWAPVNSAEDVLTDPQASSAGVFVDVPATQGAEDLVVSSVATPVDFDGASVALTAPPAVGIDTEAVLRELGMHPQELKSLHDRQVVHVPPDVSTGSVA